MNRNLRIFTIVPLALFFSCCLAQANVLMPEAPHSVAHAASHSDQGWRAVVWTHQGSELRVTNAGKEPLHLGPDVTLMPDKTVLTLHQTILQPGETLPVYGVCPHHLPAQEEVIFTLVDVNGKPGESHTLPITR